MQQFVVPLAALLRGSRLCIAATLCATAAAQGADDLPATAPAITPSPVVARLVAALEASADTCSRSSPHSADHRAVAADVARFRQRVPAAAGVPIEVKDCYWDGMVLGGERIVLSARLARATPAQRFFVIAHEYAHVSAGHHGRFVHLVTRVLRQEGSAQSASRALQRGAGAPLSRQNEVEADAIAVALMMEAGEDPEDAARFLDDAARAAPLELDTHPSHRARAAAIRALVAQRLARAP